MGVSSPQSEATINPKSIQGLKYFSALKDLLVPLHDVGTQRDKAGNRDLYWMMPTRARPTCAAKTEIAAQAAVAAG